MASEPTGRSFETPGVAVHRLAAEPVAEARNNLDALGSFDQLGRGVPPRREEGTTSVRVPDSRDL